MMWGSKKEMQKITQIVDEHIIAEIAKLSPPAQVRLLELLGESKVLFVPAGTPLDRINTVIGDMKE